MKNNEETENEIDRVPMNRVDREKKTESSLFSTNILAELSQKFLIKNLPTDYRDTTVMKEHRETQEMETKMKRRGGRKEHKKWKRG